MNHNKGRFAYLFCVGLWLMATGLLAQARYIPNQGQWPGDFLFKAPLNQGALFLTSDGYRVVLNENHPHEHGASSPTDQPPSRQVAYAMRWLNANEYNSINPGPALDHYHNYFLGKDPARWRSEVPVYQELEQRQIYPGVSLHFGSSGDHLKYDILLDDPADAGQIRMQYDGLQSIEIREGRLILETGIGQVEEYIPSAYQLVNGQKKAISCEYSLSGKEVSFKLKAYKKGVAVVIDPVLIFSSFTGSSVANWGFTATYSSDGSFYAGGIALATGFPTDSLGLQPNYGGGHCDATINKFSPEGENMLFSTYLGGEDVDIPHSMMEDANGNLVILGNTGSSQFPVTANAFQGNFLSNADVKSYTFPYHQGSQLFFTKINSSGSNILSSTYLGGTDADGLNLNIFKNYGDNNRSEVQVLPNGNIAFVSNALSRNLPLDSSLAVLTDSTQKAIVGVFSADLSNLIWGHYFGGSKDETGYALRSNGQDLIICGTTNSADLPNNSSYSYQDSLAGSYDGYLARFDAGNGQFMGSTYLGTPANDQAFLIDFDKNNDVYVFGQSEGNMPISSSIYNNPNSFQFLQKYKVSLDTLYWSTQLGSGKSKKDLVPTAMMVDNCMSIYISGWNGESNDINSGNTHGNTFNLPTTNDAFQSTTDGSDFYFMVLGRNAASLSFGSYFGGTAEEHCDGGTSRFSPDGVIYQAACAACRSTDFPTTPGAYSPTKPNLSCNYAAIKIDFEKIVRARPEVNFSLDVDTICDALQVNFSNNSIKANRYFWDFGNGQTSSDAEPQTVYNNFGVYTVMLIAEDTICDIADTNYIEVVHDTGISPTALIETEYAGCDASYEAHFRNITSRPCDIEWYFSDGTTAVGQQSTHNFPAVGSYQVMMVATDQECGRKDTAYAQLSFTDTVPEPTFKVYAQKCGNGKVQIDGSELRERYQYFWQWPDGTSSRSNPFILIEEPGQYMLSVNIDDTLCSRSYSQQFQVHMEKVVAEVFVPNAFTPNGDELNDEFLVTGNSCSEINLMQIYNRWGTLVFETERPFDHFWDGTFQERRASPGVYVYVLTTEEKTYKGHITLVR